MMVGYVAQAAVRGVKLTDCRIETEGELDLRGFLGLDEEVAGLHRRIVRKSISKATAPASSSRRSTRR